MAKKKIALGFVAGVVAMCTLAYCNKSETSHTPPAPQDLPELYPLAAGTNAGWGDTLVALAQHGRNDEGYS